MTLQFKLNSICLLWLLIQVHVQVQVQAQDIPVEFPEDFPTTTVEAVTELAETTTTATEPAPTTTDKPTMPTTTTEAPTEATTIPSTEPGPDTTTPTYPIYTPPTYVPHHPSRPTYVPQFPPWLWDSHESGGGLKCYLKEQAENKYVRWSCGLTSWKPITSCYRCCYYGYSGYAGCSKLNEGRCSSISYSSWSIY
ncbi:mucin-2 [Drosophila mojavensis]|uniref:Uncharacterized protein n=1 Tax=Drosophila mojavensis TaxID=7230 RepID=A0A0Q9XLJ4_DROMO|nr:mucin-2 [Drosophila mojavensis]KRG05207.1 uncharacterized protein Dmoj_GI26658 [Drosophila mojavensis]